MVDRGRLDYLKDLSLVDPRIRSHTRLDSAEPLPQTYAPGNWEVLCSSGKESFDHIGNRRFRVCISNNLIAYESAKSKHQKSIVVTKIVDVINECSTQERGGFVRKDLETGRWFEVEDKIAREKVGHALRDAIKITKKQMAKKRNLETPAPNQAQKRQRSEQSVAARSSVDGFAPVASPTSLVAGLASIRSGIVKKQLPKPALVAQDDECSTMGENSDLPASSYDEWKKSLKESANTFSLSDDEDAGDENSPDGDAVLSKMASETASSSDPDSMLELLNTVQLCGASPYSVNIVKPRPAQNRNSCWDTSTSFGSILLAPSQRKPADKYLWRPPGGSRTEDLYNDFLLSTAASSQVLNCSKGKKFPEKNKAALSRQLCQAKLISRTGLLHRFHDIFDGQDTERSAPTNC